MTATQSVPRNCWSKIFLFLAGRNNFKCPIAAEYGEHVAPTDLHHAGMPNTATNRKLYPLVIHSMLNLVPVSHDYHMAHGRWGQRKGYAWAERYQRFLERHPLAAQFVNGESENYLRNFNAETQET